MSENYDGNPANFPEHVRLVQDGEAASEAFLALADQDSADRTAWLRAQLALTYSSLTTSLAGVDVTTLDDGAIRNTAEGIYVYRAGATAPSGTPSTYFPWMVKPTVGDGLWFLENTYSVSSRQITVPLRPLGLAFVDTSAGDEMSGTGDFAYGNIVGPGSDKGPGIFVAQGTGFYPHEVNADPSFDGGVGEGSHYGTLVDLTPFLTPFIGLAIFNFELFLRGAAAYGANLPNVMPAFGVMAKLGSAETMRTGNLPERDPSATVADYKLTHAITYTPDKNQRIIGSDPLVARIFTEGGNHALPGTLFLGLRITIAAQ